MRGLDRRCTFIDGKELTVEGILYFLSVTEPFLSFGVQTLHTCKLSHELTHLIIIRRGYESAISLAGRVLAVNKIGLLRRYTPVAVLVGCDKPFLACEISTDMVHPFLHGAVVADYRHRVACLLIKHVAYHRKR